jgi:hypothetical protein
LTTLLLEVSDTRTQVQYINFEIATRLRIVTWGHIPILLEQLKVALCSFLISLLLTFFMIWSSSLTAILPLSFLATQAPLLQIMQPQKIPSREAPLDVDNYPVAPSNLVLEQVHVFVRHGELDRLPSL